MIALIFLWYLITTPTDKLMCTLWVKQPPTQAELIKSCGFDALGTYRIDVTPLDGSNVICSRPGDSLIWIGEDCKLPLSLDHYHLLIIDPSHTNTCPVTIEHDGQPTNSEIFDQCGQTLLDQFNNGSANLKFIKSQPKTQDAPPICATPSLPVGPGLYDQVADPGDLYTNKELTWLAGRLIWFGLVRPSCEGGTSGLDPITLSANPCGLAAAQPEVISWQNQFDNNIFDASNTYHVPSRLLKNVMIVESQFWPFWSEDMGEIGMMQVTDNGADVLLRYDPNLDPKYPSETTDGQFWKRLEVRNNFACDLCSLEEAINRTHALIPMYARLLAAYRCRAVAMNAALSGDDAWKQAVMDYNGSADYLGKVEQ